MKRKYVLLAALLFIFVANSCKKTVPNADAYGNFEAVEYFVSSEVGGKIVELRLEEGQILRAGQVVGRVDSSQLVLKIEQLQAAKRAILAKSPAIAAQLSVFEKQVASVKTQLSTLEREKRRFENLLKNDAATPKQLDDLVSQIDAAQRQLDVILEQKNAADATLSVQKSGLLAEILPLEKQILQLEDQLAKCRLTVPHDGTVLAKYAEIGEVTAPGKPIFKVADLQTMTLRAYFGAAQLSSIRVGQEVQVSVDAADGAMHSFSGKITWISPKAEFTPKIIQTRDERVNLVYAVKIAVPNSDGVLKIGMPGEVKIVPN